MTRARDLADLLTGGQTIETDDNTVQLTLKSTDADANVGPILDVIRDSASPADGDEIGRFRFKGDDDAGNETTYAFMQVKINDATDASDDGELEILTRTNGNNRSRIELLPTETVFNEDSQDIDFRVESDGNANMLFVDASTDFVGIGHNSPSTALDISGAGVPLSISSSNSNTYKIQLEDAGTVRSYLGASSAAAFSVADSSAGELLQVDSSGNVGIGTSTIKHPLHIAYSETGSIPTDHQIGASSDNKNYIGIHNTSDSATYSGIALETRTTGASRWLIANERQDNFLGDLVFLTRDGGSSGSEVVRIQNNGNVGIGVTPTQKLHVSGNAIVTGIARLGDGSASSPAYQFVSDTNTGMFRAASDTLAFSTGGSEKLRLDSNGKLYLGTTSTIAGAHISHLYDSANGSGITLKSTDSSGSTHNQVIFDRNGSTVGTISTTASNTAYGTTSDRRLKSNIEDAASASDKIDAMQVRQFDWNVDDSHQDYGLIAQELQPIEPIAVSGDADSDEMMTVDYSKLVPMLIKEIQELRGRVATLEAN